MLTNLMCVIWFRASKTGLSPTVVFLPTIPKRFLCYKCSLFVRPWFHILCLFCHCVYLNSSFKVVRVYGISGVSPLYSAFRIMSEPRAQIRIL